MHLFMLASVPLIVSPPAAAICLNAKEFGNTNASDCAMCQVLERMSCLLQALQRSADQEWGDSDGDDSSGGGGAGVVRAPRDGWMAFANAVVALPALRKCSLECRWGQTQRCTCVWRAAATGAVVVRLCDVHSVVVVHVWGCIAPAAVPSQNGL